MKAVRTTYRLVSFPKRAYYQAGQVVACDTGMLSNIYRNITQSIRSHAGRCAEKGVAAPECSIVLALVLCFGLPITAQLGGNVEQTFLSAADAEYPHFALLIQGASAPAPGRPFGETPLQGGGSETSGESQPTVCEDNVSECYMDGPGFGSHGNGDANPAPAEFSEEFGGTITPPQASGLW